MYPWVVRFAVVPVLYSNPQWGAREDRAGRLWDFVRPCEPPPAVVARDVASEGERSAECVERVLRSDLRESGAVVYMPCWVCGGRMVLQGIVWKG